MSKRDRHRKRKRKIEEAEFHKLDQAPCRFPSNPEKMSLVWPGLCSRVKVCLLPRRARTSGLIMWEFQAKQKQSLENKELVMKSSLWESERDQMLLQHP